MSKITILKSGMYTSVQDRGRFGYAKFGVPESGAIDRQSYELANGLLNNKLGNAVLECTLLGPVIRFEDSRHFVITGASTEAYLDETKIIQGKVIFAKAQSILKIQSISNGCRVYIAIDGGIDTSKILGSRSWYYPVTEHSKVSNNQRLHLGEVSYKGSIGSHIKLPVINAKDIKINAFRGPEFDMLSIKQQQYLSATIFSVSPLWSRMAIQFKEKLQNSLSDIVTGPVIPGTVQLTPSGTLIVLMRDCQVTGGYPRILQIAESGLQQLSQAMQETKVSITVT